MGLVFWITKTSNHNWATSYSTTGLWLIWSLEVLATMKCFVSKFRSSLDWFHSFHILHFINQKLNDMNLNQFMQIKCNLTWLPNISSSNVYQRKSCTTREWWKVKLISSHKLEILIDCMNTSKYPFSWLNIQQNILKSQMLYGNTQYKSEYKEGSK